LIKTEVDQLSGSLNWDAENNPDATERVPVLVHPRARRHAEATPPPGTRVITPEDLEALKASVRSFAAEISVDRGWTHPSAVSAALARHNLVGADIIRKHSRPPEPPQARP
jgi:hypothetical protein